MMHLPQEEFFQKNIIFMYHVAPFLVHNFKNSYGYIQSYGSTQFLGLNWPNCPEWDLFSKKTINTILTYLSNSLIMQFFKKSWESSVIFGPKMAYLQPKKLKN